MRRLFPISLFLALALFSCQSQDTLKEKDESSLWPVIEPYESGYLKVSDIHELYYEVSGNPQGKPVIVLHGGPGGTAFPVMRRYFNPDRFKIVLFDQRGAGRSKPYAEIRENNTQALVEDIETLRKQLDIEKAVIFGGSWGSTLALAYAEEHPERVEALVMRAIFTATKREIDHFYHGGTAEFYPDTYKQLLDSIQAPGRDSLPQYLAGILMNGDEKTRKKVARAWLRYEWVISDIRVNEQEVDDFLKKNDPYAFSLIENYYMANGCFLEEGQLWKNLGRITHIPCVIVNGRLDMPCPPVTAWNLHRQWPGSRLEIIQDEGHFGPGIEKALVGAMKQFE